MKGIGINQGDGAPLTVPALPQIAPAAAASATHYDPRKRARSDVDDEVEWEHDIYDE